MDVETLVIVQIAGASIFATTELLPYNTELQKLHIRFVKGSVPENSGKTRKAYTAFRKAVVRALAVVDSTDFAKFGVDSVTKCYHTREDAEKALEALAKLK